MYFANEWFTYVANEWVGNGMPFANEWVENSILDTHSFASVSWGDISNVHNTLNSSRQQRTVNEHTMDNCAKLD